MTFVNTQSARAGYTSYAGLNNTPPLGTIQGEYLNSSTLNGNNFTNVGNAISLSYANNNNFTSNNFDQIGGLAVSLRYAMGGLIQYNQMTSISQINIGASAVNIQDSSNITVDSNYMNGIGRMGVNVQSVNLTSTFSLAISNNVIISSNQQTDDSAAIYMYGGSASSYDNISTTVTGNRVESSGALLFDANGNPEFAQNRGIYMDDKISGVTLTKNVTENNHPGILLCHGCMSNTANNNVAILHAQPLFTSYNGTQSSGTGSITRILCIVLQVQDWMRAWISSREAPQTRTPGRSITTLFGTRA